LRQFESNSAVVHDCRIAERSRDGHPTSVAEQTLEALQVTVSSLHDKKASIEDALRNVERGKGSPH
jgi:hypothetical protein